MSEQVAITTDIIKIRQAIANYMKSEGCSCCESSSHNKDKEKLCQLLGIPMYDDESGYDFYAFCSE